MVNFQLYSKQLRKQTKLIILEISKITAYLIHKCSDNILGSDVNLLIFYGNSLIVRIIFV